MDEDLLLRDERRRARPEAACIDVEASEAGSIAVAAKLDARSLQVPLRQGARRPNRTGASLPEIRRLLSRTWQFLLAQRMDDANELIDHIELQIDGLPTLAARRLTEATHLLRAVSLAFDDHWLAAYTMAQVHMDRNGAPKGAARTLYKIGLWKLMRQQAFQAASSQWPGNGCSRSEATAAGFDLSIEAAFAIDQLRLTTAKRLATHAYGMFQASQASRTDAAEGLILLPLSLIALVHYEQGDLHDAERLIGDRLPLVDAEGSIESALRCYLVLARIARHRMQYDLAGILLSRGEALGERRGWPRLALACMAEKVSCLLEIGRREEARLCLERCDRYIEASARVQGERNHHMAQYRMIIRCRLSWAEAPTEMALAAFRKLHGHAVEFGTPYAACRLATEYATMLASVGETAEADALFLSAVRRGSSAGLNQTYLEGGAQTGGILQRIYQHIDTSTSADRDLLPLLGGLLLQWQTRMEQHQAAASAYVKGTTFTERERDTLNGICQGLTNKSIARTLNISPETVKSHAKRIFIKLGVRTRSEAVSRSKSLGLL